MEFPTDNPGKLIENLPEALFLEDSRGNILDVNEQACKLLGYEKEELLQLTVDDIVPESAPAFLPGEVDEVTGAGEALETTNLRKEGTELPVELRGRIMEFEGREVILVSIRDISERKRTEAKLRKANKKLKESKERYRSYFEELGDAVFILEMSEGNVGDIMDVNSAAETQTGYSREELLEMNILEDLVLSDLPEAKNEEVSRKLASGKAAKFTEKKVRKDGSEYWTEVVVSPIEYQGKQANLSINRDVTDRKEAERELKRSQERLELALEGTETGLWDWKIKTGKMVFNEEWARLLGYEREELFPMTEEEWEKLVHQEDLRRSNELLEAHFKGETEVYECEMRLKHKTGDWVWILSRGHVVEWNDQGEPIRMVGTHQDVTDRKKAEEKLREARAFLDAALDGLSAHLAIIDDRGEIVRVNEAWRKFAEENGLEADEVSEGSNYLQICKNATGECSGGAEEFAHGLRKVKSGEKDIYSQEYPCHSPNEQRWFIGRVTPFPGRERKHLVITHENITERKLAERALQEERDKLRNLHYAVDKLQQQEKEQEVLDTAVEVAEEMLGFDVCALGIREGDQIVTKALSREIEPESTTSFKIGEGITGKTLQKGETIWGNDLDEFPEAKVQNPAFQSFISVPIGEIGTFQVVSTDKNNFDQRDVELTEVLAGHLREEIKRVRLEEELRQQAIRDPLTGLYNRRYFNETLQKEMEQADRYNKPLAFLMLDINRFKEINDRYSHQTGDEVLKRVAELIKSNVRGADTVVRYGGDEFLVMLPETDGETRYIQTRLRDNLSQWNREAELIDFPLSLAMGMAHWEPDQGRDVEDVLKEADRRMYQDKRDAQNE